MSDFTELAPDCGVDGRVAVPVKISPDGRIGIEILLAVGITEHRAASFDDHDRLLPQPIPHLGEWVPNELVIELSQLVHERISNTTPDRDELLDVRGGVGGGDGQTQPRLATGHCWISNCRNENALLIKP